MENPLFKLFLDAIKNGDVTPSLFEMMVEGAKNPVFDDETLGLLYPIIKPITLRPVLERLKEELRRHGKISLEQFRALLLEEVNPSEVKNVA